MIADLETRMVHFKLTEAEKVVARELVNTGGTSKEIGERIFRSKRSVDFHIYYIVRKLKVSNRVQMIRRLTVEEIPE